ncbi:MAG: MarR family transcriptional regulator [Deltaproteobacteria bacterium]|nr:MarR family transcriptional regulator [Deltaproteobacteria bacterium]
MRKSPLPGPTRRGATPRGATPPGPGPNPPTDRAPLHVTPALDLLRLLLHVSHGIERVSLRMESSLGVTAQQRLVLRVIGRHPGITPGRLADHLHVDPGTISAIVRRLESKRLVKRGTDPRDRRRATLGLSESGRTLDRELPGTVEEVVERVLGAHDDATRRTVQSLLSELAHALEHEASSDR